MKALSYSMALVMLVLGLSACQDLAVENENNPNRLQALAAPQDVETLGFSLLRQYYWATQDCEMAFLLATMADEVASSWANWGMRDLSSEPRIEFNNTPSYSRATAAESAWFRSYEGISNANDILIALNVAEAAESVDNNTFTRAGVDTGRLRTWAKLMQGLFHAWVATYYDQGFVVTEDVDLEEVAAGTTELTLVPYDQVMDAALVMIDRAIALAQQNTFTIESGDDWIFGLTVTNQDLVRLANSWYARYMTMVARDAGQRGNVAWSEVLQRINAGITADFVPIGNDNGAEPGEWDCTKFFMQNGTTWSRVDYRTLGPADVGGGYQNWLATPLQDRLVFDVNTPDRRIVGSATDLTVDGTDFQYQGNNGPFPPDRGTYHYSSHNHKRYQEYNAAGANGPMPGMLVAEMDMLRAEALLRTGGSKQVVADLINKTRVGRGQMNAISASNASGSPSDVQAIGDNASLWSLLKHEKRIETLATAGGLAFYDDRGWGDLVTGTPIHFPVPGAELQTLGLQLYTFGGGGMGSAPKVERANGFEFHTPK